MKSRNQGPRLFAAGAALAAGLLLADAATAQNPRAHYGTPWERGAGQESAQGVERRVELLTEQLQLSADQAAQIRRILEEEHARLQATGADSRRPRTSWGADAGGARRTGSSPEADSLRQRTDRQIELVLNEWQRARYRELHAERGGR